MQRLIARINRILKPRGVPIKPLCLCCYPEYHKEVGGTCVFDGKPWPCVYIIRNQPFQEFGDMAWDQ